jgi:hypothetical protein
VRAPPPRDEARGWDVNEVVMKEPMWCVHPHPVTALPKTDTNHTACL